MSVKRRKNKRTSGLFKAVVLVFGVSLAAAFIGFIGPALLSSKTDEGPLAAIFVVVLVCIGVLAKLFNGSK